MGLMGRVIGMMRGQEEQAPAERPGRNDPCWCGSGRKYKKCHLLDDDKNAAARVCAANCGPT